MVAVLPILLYPLLGMSLFQISQFMQEQPTRVLVVGPRTCGDLPPLFENEQFAGAIVCRSREAELLELDFSAEQPCTGRSGRVGRQGRSLPSGSVGQVRGGAVFSARFCRPARRFPRSHPQPRAISPLLPGEGPGVRAGSGRVWAGPHPNPLPKGEGTVAISQRGEGTGAGLLRRKSLARNPLQLGQR